jgi:hypothetical protein
VKAAREIFRNLPPIPEECKIEISNSDFFENKVALKSVLEEFGIYEEWMDNIHDDEEKALS